MKEARRVVVDYDELLANPYSQIVRISTRLGLPVPNREDSRVKDFEDNFLESGLRHTFFTENDLASDARASPMVSAAYGLLRRLATDRESLGNSCVQDELDELNARLKEASPAFDYINLLEDGIGPEMAKRDSQIDSLRQVVAGRDRQISAYREQAERIVPRLHEANLRIASLNQDLAGRDRSIVNLNQVVTERDGQINAYREQAERIVAQLYEARTRISHLDQDVVERDLHIARLTQEVTEYTQRDAEAEGAGLPDGFDPDIYLELNPDVAAAGLDPEMHYLRHGRRERRIYQLSATNVCGDDDVKESRSDLRNQS